MELLLKLRSLKKNDKLVWLYTDNLGKITTIAKGAKKIKAGFSQLLYHFVMESLFCLKEKVYITYKKEK